MRLRRFDNPDDDLFDGLTAEDIRRIRAMGATDVTPGLEGLVARPEGEEPEETPKGKRGVRRGSIS